MGKSRLGKGNLVGMKRVKLITKTLTSIQFAPDLEVFNLGDKIDFEV